MEVLIARVNRMEAAVIEAQPASGAEIRIDHSSFHTIERFRADTLRCEQDAKVRGIHITVRKYHIPMENVGKRSGNYRLSGTSFSADDRQPDHLLTPAR
jgi:hypothetical protein